METFQVEALADKRPQEISGGQKQRVCLARALMQRPRALLLDEPFSALDLPNRKKMRECLAETMRGLGIPVILVTHDLVEALSLADELLIVAAGRVVQRGRPAEVVARPVDAHVASLVDLDNLRVKLK
jgi:molybdate transport system ATP-binding protein